MASGYKSKNVYAPGSPKVYPYTFTISFNEKSTDKINNTSSIDVTGTMYAKDIRWSGTTNTLAIYWVDDNENTTPKLLKSLDISTFVKNNTYTLSETINVDHKSNGTLKGYAKLVFTKKHTNDYAPNTTELFTDNTSLITIPRESSMVFGDGYVEEILNISISRNDASFTHKITYSFGSLSGIVTSSAGASYSWTIPTNFYSQISKKYRTGTLYLETYSGSTKIGDTKSYPITIYCLENKCVPTITGTISDTNPITVALTGSSQTLVDYKSVAEINLTYSAKNSSSISKLYINGTLQTLGTKYVLTPNASKYTIRIEDTRGYSAECEFQSSDSSKSNYFKRINYIPLNYNATTSRPTQTGSEMQTNLIGNYFNGTFSSSKNNSLTISWKCREKGQTTWANGATAITPTIINNTFKTENLKLVNPLTTNGAWDYQKVYEIMYTARDELMSFEYQNTISKGEAGFAIFGDGVMLNGIFLSIEKVDEW